MNYIEQLEKVSKANSIVYEDKVKNKKKRKKLSDLERINYLRCLDGKNMGDNLLLSDETKERKGNKNSVFLMKLSFFFVIFFFCISFKENTKIFFILTVDTL